MRWLLQLDLIMHLPNFSNKTVLITGGCGFIGTNLIEYLLEHSDAQIINIDLLTYAANAKYSHDQENYKFYQLDINNSKAIERIFKEHQPDWMMHLAAESHVDRSIACADNFIHTNINGTFSLLTEARKYWLELSSPKKESFRFLHVSTDEVFGSLDENGAPFSESTGYKPNSPYSASKASSDFLVRSWNHTFGLPTLITHCGNNFGPHQHSEKFIPCVTQSAILGKPIPLYGSGMNVRDWIYVEDHVRGLLVVLLKGEIGESYNIGAGNEIRNINIIKLIAEVLVKLGINTDKSMQSYLDLIHYVDDRPGHDYRYSIDATKVMSNLGWSPVYPFERALQHTIEWILQHHSALKLEEVYNAG